MFGLLNLIFGALMVALGLFDSSGSGDGGGAEGGEGGQPAKGGATGGGSNSGDEGKPSDTDDDGDLAKWKSLARKHEGRLKALGINTPEEAEELRKAAKRLKEIEDANKSELDKAKDGQTAAERRATEAETQLMRLQVALDKGLSPAQAKRLVGATREDLEADAEELLQAFKAEAGNGANGRPAKPETGLRSKAAPGSEPPEELDPDTLAAKVPRV